MSTSENLEVLFELEYDQTFIGYHMGYIIQSKIYILDQFKLILKISSDENITKGA